MWKNGRNARIASPSGLCLLGFHDSGASPAVIWRVLATMFLWLNMTPDRHSAIILHENLDTLTLWKTSCSTGVDEES